ncbi:MAG: tRNA preQ1(34) S-adenosylmethionine ribosyltransferase-isomerase QueA [Acidobacteria bacterium]|nr:MAG: tRNA preQ1(34) S-adenosylmethionine ribosyltransferase-isomerase QueA [Acidobacteriota bacterium]
MLLEEFDYELPKELIARRPLKERDASRMMLLDRARQSYRDCAFLSLPEILAPGDLLVVNNTRVFPARLLGKRVGTQAQAIGKGNPAAREHLTAEVELLLTRNETGDVWQGLVHPGRKVRTGEVLVFGGGELEAEVLGRGECGVRRVLLRAREGSVAGAIDRLGHVPLPPYIDRPDDATDRETYQTVYARVRGAVAAPTAGFHFTQRVLDALSARKIEVCEITLHVGPGTFRPVQTERVEDHKMEPEEFEISEAAAASINHALEDGRRVIAVGTTSVRTLESVALQNEGKVVPCRGETSLFIVPGFRFQAVRGLLTNFHLPKSTLLMLVSAFAGRGLVLSAYRHAIEERYRFYSYGDCMLIL